MWWKEKQVWFYLQIQHLFATIKLQNFCKRHVIETKQNKNFLCIRYRFKTKGLSVCQTVFDRIGTCSYYFIQQKMLLNDIAVNSHFWFIWTNVKCNSGLFWRIISDILRNLFLAYKTGNESYLCTYLHILFKATRRNRIETLISQ